MVIADLAGGSWPARAREAAVGTAMSAPDSNPIALLLFDMVMQFVVTKTERMFSSELVRGLTAFGGRPWGTLLRGKAIDERWVARQLQPYGIRPRNLRINGEQAKGYEKGEVLEVCLRYVSKAELRALMDELQPGSEATPGAALGDNGVAPTESSGEDTAI